MIWNSVKWVDTSKFVDGERQIKSHLAAHGFQEKQDDILTDSPTCAKESLRLVLNVISSKKWTCQTIDIKTAFLQGRETEGEVYITPPKEAGVDPGSVCKLKKTMYGLQDASRAWYLHVIDKLICLGANPSKYDSSVFIWHYQGKLKRLLCMHVDNFLFGGDKDFMTLVINPLREAFVIGSEHSRAFKYLGLDLKQTKDHQILLDQNLYLNSINEIQINKDRLNLKNSPLTYEELKDYRILIGQLCRYQFDQLPSPPGLTPGPLIFSIKIPAPRTAFQCKTPAPGSKKRNKNPHPQA